MTFEELERLIRKHFYIIFREKFYLPDSDLFLERYVAKHPLLRPQLIVHEDQLQGFKRRGKRLATLEKFPIYIEIEGAELEDGEVYIENVDVYSEANLSCQHRLKDIIYLSKVFSDSVNMDRVFRLSSASDESLVVISRLSESIMSEFYRLSVEDEIEGQDVAILTEKTGFDIESTMDHFFGRFVEFIKHLDDIIVKNKPLPDLKKMQNE